MMSDDHCDCMTDCECEAGDTLTDCGDLHDNHQVGDDDLHSCGDHN